MNERIWRRPKLKYPTEIECRSKIKRITDKRLFRKGVSYLDKGNLTAASENAIYLAERISLVSEGPVGVDQDKPEIVESEMNNKENDVDVRSVYLWLGRMRNRVEI